MLRGVTTAVAGRQSSLSNPEICRQAEREGPERGQCDHNKWELQDGCKPRSSFQVSIQASLSEILHSGIIGQTLPRVGLWSTKASTLYCKPITTHIALRLLQIQQASHSSHLRWICIDVCSPNLLYFSALQTLMWVWINWQDHENEKEMTVRCVLRFYISNKLPGDALLLVHWHWDTR